MTRALVVLAHPVAESLVAAAFTRAVGALRESGAVVDELDLYARRFDPLRPSHDDAVRLRACDTLVLVYPTWFGAQPAILKGWLDHVWAPGTTFPDIRRIVAITTHGSPRRVNLVAGESGRMLVLRGLRTRCHPECRARWLALYGNDRCGPRERERFLDRIGASIVAATRVGRQRS